MHSRRNRERSKTKSRKSISASKLYRVRFSASVAICGHLHTPAAHIIHIIITYVQVYDGKMVNHRGRIIRPYRPNRVSRAGAALAIQTHTHMAHYQNRINAALRFCGPRARFSPGLGLFSFCHVWITASQTVGICRFFGGILC